MLSPSRAALVLVLGAMALPACDRAASEASLPDEPTSSAPPAPTIPPPVASTGGPSELPAVPFVEGPPRITFVSDTYDFGRVAETEEHTGAFQFANTGGETLVIEEVRATCGCTAITLGKKSYAPGEQGRLEIVFDPAGPGDQKKYVNVISNAEPDPLVRLKVVADVQPFVELEPRMVELGVVPLGAGHQVVLSLGSEDAGFRVDALNTTNPHVSAEVKGAGTARSIEVNVSPDAPWGGLFSWLTVTINGRPSPGAEPITYTARVRIQGQVFGALAAEPDTFRFGVKPGERFDRTIRLAHREGAAFEVFGATVEATNLPEVDVIVEPRGPGAYELLLSAVGGDRLGSYRGTVVVRTSVPGEDELRIPISGVVRTRPGGVK